MAKQTINIGTTANDGTGDPIRAAFGKVNDNFTEIYTANTGVNTGDQNLSAYATTAAVAAGYQPLDSDLTAISALTTTAYGRALLSTADAGTLRNAIGVGQTDAPTFLAITLNDTPLVRDDTGKLAQRNGLAKQTLRIYNTYTSASIYERAVMDWNGPTFGNLQIGTEFLGSGSGMAARPIDFVTGGVVRMSISAAGALSVIAAISSNSSISAGATLSLGGSSVVLKDAGSLVLQILNSGQSAGVVLDAATDGVAKFRLRGNAAFATLQGKLTTDTAYTATVVTPTGFLTLYDSTGTAYRVPCVV